MKLYELTNEFNQALIDLDGMNQDVIKDTLEGLTGGIEEKSKNVIAYFLNLDADIAAMKDAEQKIAKRRKSLENQSSGLKDYLRHNMEASGITKIESPEFKVTLGKPSKVCNVFSAGGVPSEFREEVKTAKVNKAGLKKWMLAEGLTECEGAEIVDGKSQLLIK